MGVSPSRVILLLLCCLLCGCATAGAGSDTGASTDAPCTLGKPQSGSSAPLLPGKLIETGTTTLEEWNSGHRQTIACTSGQSSYFEFPTFSPDGKLIAYVLASTPTGAGQDWGNDVYVAAADGSGTKLVLKHDAVGALIDAIAWTSDGSALILGYNRAVFDASGRYQSSILQIQRLDLATGARTVLIQNASQPSLSWDGKSIAFVFYPSPDNLQASDLAVANLDGSNPHEILTNQHGFQAYFAPHLSPDGTRVVFAAVGGPLPAPTPAGRAPGQKGPGLAALSLARSWLGPQAASADGTPYQVWVSNLDGSNLHTVANLMEDLPYPLWASDGRSILFLGSAALYLASADGSSQVKRIDKGVTHGQIAWYQH
jgi:Tol biopolymer transport system component